MPKTTATTRVKKNTSATGSRAKAPAKRPLLTGTIRKSVSPKSAPERGTSVPHSSTRKRSTKPAATPKAPASRRRGRTASALHSPVLPVSVPVARTGLPEVVTQCLAALDEKKAGELQVLDVRGKSSVTDFFIIATATSEPHLRALRVALEKELAGTDTRILHREASAESGWCVVDAFDVIIHLFLAEKRAAYDIEGLWAKAPRHW